MLRQSRKIFPYLFVYFIVLSLSGSIAKADLIDDLKSKIDERNQAIKNLDLEIAQYQAQIEKTSSQGQTLKGKINSLELTRKKLLSEIYTIQNKILVANLSIDKLKAQISFAEGTIQKDRFSIQSTLVQINEEETASFVEVLMNHPSISIFLDKVESLGQLNQGLQDKLKSVRSLKKDVEQKKSETESQRKQLINLAGSLTDKKKVTEYNKAQTAKVLADTKNQEALYRKTLQEKQALHDAFSDELLNFESQLKVAIDPSSMPTLGKGVLQWPIDKVFVTQYFGNTEFSKTHAQAYNGRGHNGIDLRATTGAPIKSALSGVVSGVGDTDKACPGASYGRWVLIKHDNGLSTLYAHLSVIKVTGGQNVKTGELIGYAGETGYATGPHLHFSVYASQGVEIQTRKSKVCNASYTMPIGSLNSYINPLLYI